MIKESDLTKLYYSIGEVAEMFDVNASLIRFWEKEFPSIKPRKNKKGNRLFSPRDILELQNIYHLVKTEGYTLEGAKKALKDPSLEAQLAQSEEAFDKEKIVLRLLKIKEKLKNLK